MGRDGIIEVEVPKYLKKQESNVSKANAKAKHKHEYKPCILDWNNWQVQAQYCTVCGRLSNVQLFSMFVKQEQKDVQRFYIGSTKLPKYIELGE